jgi:hypothetical protein
MPDTAISPEEIARRGQEIYDKSLRDKLEPEHKGELLVLNIETGEYEMDKDDRLAFERARNRWPSSVFYFLRVGYRTTYHLGFPIGRRRE